MHSIFKATAGSQYDQETFLGSYPEGSHGGEVDMCFKKSEVDPFPSLVRDVLNARHEQQCTRT